jgi:hypothetical protein
MKIVESPSKYVENLLANFEASANPSFFYRRKDELTRRANFTLPQTSAPISGCDMTNVSTMDENCWTDSRMPQRRLATQRLLRLAFSSSTSLVKVITAAASGTALSA